MNNGVHILTIKKMIETIFRGDENYDEYEIIIRLSHL